MTSNRPLEEGNIQVYNELSAAAVVRTQPKLLAFFLAGAVLVICHPEVLSIGASFPLSGAHHLLTEV